MRILKLIVIALVALFLFKILLGLLIGAAFMGGAVIIVFAVIYLGWRVLFR